tara:strand:+ start:1506 stop:1886 length:381 start_codon:yes stop_codon:yes gene_type:complete
MLEKSLYEVYANIQLASPDRLYNKKELDHIKKTLNEWFMKWTDGEVRLSEFNYPHSSDWYASDVLEHGLEVWVGLTFEVSVEEHNPKFMVFNWTDYVLDLNFFPNEQTIFDFTDGEYKGEEFREIA